MARPLPGILVIDSLPPCHLRKKLPDSRTGRPEKHLASGLQAPRQAGTEEEPKDTWPRNAACILGGVLEHKGHSRETGTFDWDLHLS